MFFILSKILEFLLLPLTWIIILSIAGCTKFALAKRCRIAGLFLLLIFTNPFLVNVAMRLWEVPGQKNSSITKDYDVAVLLGGSMRYYNGDLERPVYSSSADRLLQTIALYKEGRVKKILLTGGSGRVLQPDEKESVLIKKVLMESHIPESDIILENESRNTYQNAVYSAEIIKNLYDEPRVLVITSAYHMRRSLACFYKAGLICDPWAVDQRSGNGTLSPDRIIVPDAAVLETWDILFHEWFGVIVYKIMGYC